MKYKIELICSNCKKIINTAENIPDKETADKVYSDALINPLIGWCDDCNMKPMPKLIENSPPQDN